MKNNHKQPILWMLCFLMAAACSKKVTDYRSFLGNQENTYPGIIANPTVLPGNGRLMLTWRPNSDPSVTKYVVYWNNNADSLVVNAISHNTSDTVKCIIGNLAEYAYTFFINSYDASGNKSVVTEIDNAKVFGTIYQSSLHNRLPNVDTPYVVNDNGTVKLKFVVPDTINITTIVKYINANGVAAQASLSPDSIYLTLPSFQSGTPVLYQSTYIPVHGSLDTFIVSHYDTFPAIKRIVDVTAMYIKNPGNPFLRSDNGTGKWGLPKDWQYNSNVINQNGSTAGGWSTDNGGVIHFETQDWGGNGVSNGKIYQSFTLPQGDYSVDYTTGGYGGDINANLVVSIGTVLPDVDKLSNSLALFHGDQNTIGGNHTIGFSLAQSTTVAIGWVVSTGTYTYLQFKSIKLRSLQ